MAASVQLGHWAGAFSSARPEKAEVSLVFPVRQSSSGGSGAFLGRGSDSAHYWIKTLNNQQGERVPATEQIVARVGALIGAPVCIARTIEIPGALAGWEFRPGRALEAGIAHASLAVDDPVEQNVLVHRTDDDNARRHCAILALYDWCWGGDQQWLVSTSAENQYFSHDHGWYLPPTGPLWTAADMQATIDEAHALADPGDAISEGIADEVARKLEGVTHDHLVAALRPIPTSWAVADTELEMAGFYLEYRASSVAARLRARFVGGR